MRHKPKATIQTHNGKTKQKNNNSIIVIGRVISVVTWTVFHLYSRWNNFAINISGKSVVLWWVHGRTCMFQFTQGKIEMMDGFGKHCSPVTLRTSCVFICTTSRFPFPNGGTSLRTNQILFICPGVPRWLSLFPNPNYSVWRFILYCLEYFGKNYYQDTEHTVINPSSCEVKSAIWL